MINTHLDDTLNYTVFYVNQHASWNNFTQQKLTVYVALFQHFSMNDGKIVGWEKCLRSHSDSS